MIQVLVADSSAIIRSVLKEIILKTKKLSWIGEAVSYDSLKSMSLELKPDFIITNKALFDSARSTALSDYCHTAEIPTLIYYAPGEKTEYSSKNINYLEMPQFINFSSEKINEYTKYLEQHILDIKCSVLFENHPSSVVPAINEDGSYSKPLQNLPKDFSKRHHTEVDQKGSGYNSDQRPCKGRNDHVQQTDNSGRSGTDFCRSLDLIQMIHDTNTPFFITFR